MNAHIGVVKTAAMDSVLDRVVIAALSARKALAVFGSLLMVFCLGVSLVLAPALGASETPPARTDSSFQIAENPGIPVSARDAAREERSPSRTAARSAREAQRLRR